MLIKSFARSALTLSFTKNKIDRHLRDINDTISEEDINNISIHPLPEHRVIINKGVIEFVEDRIEELPESLEFQASNSNWNIS